MRDPADDPLDRLSDAVDAFVEFKASGSSTSAEELLSRHGDLRDLLEPMLAGDDVSDGSRALRVGSFRIERELGRGGMGIVYEAVDESLDRRVALKLLPPELSLSPRRLTRFRREAAIIAKLDHPGIVRVHQVGEVDGRHFIAMELVAAQSLEERLAEVRADARGRPEHARSLTSGATLSYPLQVAEVCQKAAAALAHAHDNDVVHRDVKPSNILFHEDGRVCLADFGLAFDSESVGLSRSGDFVGTPYYVSPEQLTMRGAGADPRMDVFALGVVLYESLTFAHPFDGETTEEVLYAITFREPAPPTRINPLVPRDLETVCLRALAKDPGRRYPSARALGEDLGRVLRREPIAARPRGRLERLLGAARRRPAHAIAIASTGLILLGAPVAGMLHLKLAHDAVVEEQRHTETQRKAALRNLDRSRNILDELMTEVADGVLVADPEGQSLRFRILDRAAAHHEEIARESPTPEVVLDAARAYGRLGRAAQQTGEYDRAVEAFSKALDFFEQVEAESESPVARADHAATHLRRAIVNGELGRSAEARREFTDAYATLEAVAREDSTALGTFAARELTRGSRQRAAQIGRSGSVAEAKSLLASAREQLARWQGSPFAADVAEPTGPRVEAGLLEFEAARLALTERRLDEAEAGFERARERFELLAADGNWWAESELPTLTAALARVAAARGDRVRALAMGAEVIAQLDELVQRHPASLELKRRQAEQLASFSRKLLGGPRNSEAAEFATRGLQLAEDLVAAAPDRPAHIALLAGAAVIRGAVQRYAVPPDRSGILSDFERGVACYEELAARWPDVVEHKRELGGALSNCAECRFSLAPSEPEVALDLLRNAIDLQREVLAGNGDDATARAYVRNHLRVLGKVALALDSESVLLEVARQMREFAGGQPDRIVAATTWLLRSAEARGAATGAAEAAARDAIQWLGEAVDLGYEAASLSKVRELEVLATHPGFRALVEAR